MTMSLLSPKLPLIESDPAAANEIRAALTAAGSGRFNVEWVRQLSEGLERLRKRGIPAVLLALSRKYKNPPSGHSDRITPTNFRRADSPAKV